MAMQMTEVANSKKEIAELNEVPAVTMTQGASLRASTVTVCQRVPQDILDAWSFFHYLTYDPTPTPFGQR